MFSNAGAGVTSESSGDGSGGFFAEIGDAVTGTVKDVLPVWTKQELIDQGGDQLRDPTFNGENAGRSLFGGNTTGGTVNSPGPRVQRTLGDIVANIDPVTAIGLTLAVFGGVYLLRRF